MSGAAKSARSRARMIGQKPRAFSSHVPRRSNDNDISINARLITLDLTYVQRTTSFSTYKDTSACPPIRPVYRSIPLYARNKLVPRYLRIIREYSSLFCEEYRYDVLSVGIRAREGMTSDPDTPDAETLRKMFTRVAARNAD